MKIAGEAKFGIFGQDVDVLVIPDELGIIIRTSANIPLFGKKHVENASKSETDKELKAATEEILKNYYKKESQNRYSIQIHDLTFIWTHVPIFFSTKTGYSNIFEKIGLIEFKLEGASNDSISLSDGEIDTMVDNLFSGANNTLENWENYATKEYYLPKAPTSIKIQEDRIRAYKTNIKRIAKESKKKLKDRFRGKELRTKFWDKVIEKLKHKDSKYQAHETDNFKVLLKDNSPAYENYFGMRVKLEVSAGGTITNPKHTKYITDKIAELETSYKDKKEKINKKKTNINTDFDTYLKLKLEDANKIIPLTDILKKEDYISRNFNTGETVKDNAVTYFKQLPKCPPEYTNTDQPLLGTDNINIQSFSFLVKKQLPKGIRAELKALYKEYNFAGSSKLMLHTDWKDYPTYNQRIKTALEDFN